MYLCVLTDVKSKQSMSYLLSVPCVNDDTPVVENGSATARQPVSVDCKPLVEDQVGTLEKSTMN